MQKSKPFDSMEQIGRYEIASELGRGAMGIVYRARDPRIGREVAIKTIKPADQADRDEIEDLRERLFREAQSAGCLSHPGIVTIFDVDEQDGLVYIAMELVEGQTLDRYVSTAGDTARSPGFAVDLLLQVGDALDYAHRRGIVHRDIKPSNIMISPDGVKIMDFGVARIASSQLTRTGAVMGTPNYMSPEQVKGEDLDGRSDQFSLGAIGYELLTGKKPFQASNLTSTIFKIVSADPVRPRQLNPQISAPLEAAVLRALAKDPDGRFAVCREFAEAAAAAVERMRAGGENVVLSAGLAGLGESDETMGAAPAQQDVTQADVRLNGAPAEPPPAKPRTAEEPAGKSAPKKAAPILPEPARKKRASEPPPERAAAGTLRGFEEEKRRRWPLAIFLLLIAATGGLAFVLFSNPALLDDPGRLLQVVLGSAPDIAADEPPPAAGPLTPALPAPAPEPAPNEPAAAELPVPDALPAVSEGKSLHSNDLAQSDSGEEPAAETDANAADAAAEPAPSEAAPPAAETAAQPPLPPVSTPLPAFAPVTFMSNPAGAEITVDHRAEWTCTAPCEPMALPGGRHTATVTLDGYRPQRRSFDVGAEPLEIPFSLQPIRATLMITSRPPDGDIYIDGRKTGRQTPERIAVPPGLRVVRVVKGDLSAERTIEAAGDGLHALNFTLGNR